MPVPYSALVLAGGSARRFGGADKGLQLLNGQPLVQHTLAGLAAQTLPPAEVLISANRNLDSYLSYGYPVYPDSRPGFQGPLAGIAEGLAHAQHAWLLVVPCDVATLPRDFAERMFRASAGAEAVCACDAARQHPSMLLLQTMLYPRLAEFLHGDNRRIRDWLASLKLKEVLFPQPFANLNSPEDLAAHLARR
jgi:molybdopterin-guanine dinucleotide biosynthesis protein A